MTNYEKERDEIHKEQKMQIEPIEKTVDDNTPDETPPITITLTAQQLHLIYWFLVEVNEKEQSIKLDRIADKINARLETVKWTKEGEAQ